MGGGEKRSGEPKKRQPDGGQTNKSVRTGGREGGEASRQIHAGRRARRACGGRRTSEATWEGDVSLYERTKIGHGCLGEISLGGVTRQLTLHLVVVVLVVGGDGQEKVSRGESCENDDCVGEKNDTRGRCGGSMC